MPMGRFLCQLCWSIVHYGERHPCFFYKTDDEVYTVPPPNEPEEIERKDEKCKRTPTGNLIEKNGNTCAAVQQNCIEECNETPLFLIDHKEGISLMPASRRKRSRFYSLPSKLLRGRENGHSYSKSASSTHKERDGSKDASQKSKKYRKIESASAVFPQICNTATTEMTTKIVTLGSDTVFDAAAAAFGAGPSVIQAHSQKTQKEKPFVCDVCGRVFDTRQHLEEHMRTHTGEKPFVCNTCGKGFSQQSHLTRHLQTRTGEKPYKCQWCGKKFADLRTGKRHLKQIHGEE